MAKGKGRKGKRDVPIMGLAVLGSFVAGVLTNNDNSRQSRPIDYMKQGEWVSAGTMALENMKSVGTYTPMAVPLVIWGVVRVAIGKKPLVKGVSLA